MAENVVAQAAAYLGVPEWLVLFAGIAAYFIVVAGVLYALKKWKIVKFDLHKRIRAAHEQRKTLSQH